MHKIRHDYLSSTIPSGRAVGLPTYNIYKQVKTFSGDRNVALQSFALFTLDTSRCGNVYIEEYESLRVTETAYLCLCEQDKAWVSVDVGS